MRGFLVFMESVRGLSKRRTFEIQHEDMNKFG